MYMSISFAPKLSRRTATPPAVFVQNDGATPTVREYTSHAPEPVVGGVASGCPVESKHLPPRSPLVYVPAANVGPAQFAVVATLSTDPLAGVAARAVGESVASSARTMLVTTNRRKAASLRVGS